MSLYLRNVTFLDWRAADLKIGGPVRCSAGKAGLRFSDAPADSPGFAPQARLVLQRGNMIVDEGPEGGRRFTEDAPSSLDTVIDCSRRLVMEGLACGHHHIYSALARGMPPPPRPPRGFAEILELVWWRLDKALDLDMIRASALSTAVACLQCGVTRIVDHHASPNAIEGSLSTMAAALEECGLTHVLCLELSDRDGPERAAAGLAETDAYLDSGRPGMVGLHASFTVGDELLSSAVELAQKHGVGLHVHVAEGDVDQERCMAEHGKRVVDRFGDAGVLDQAGSILVHCLHLSEAERERVHSSPVWVAHNPESNQKNGVGFFRWDGLDPSRVMIGTDGMHSDVIRSARAAFLAGSASGGLDPALPWGGVWNNLRFMESHHPKAMRANDLVVLDYDPPTPVQAENIVGHAMFGLDSRQVRTVIAGGRVVLDEGRLTSVDEEQAMRQCREQAERLWSALTRA